MIFGVLPQLFFWLCILSTAGKKNAVMGKGIAVVVVLGAGSGACREQIQTLPREEAVQSALPFPLPYCLLKITNY